MYLFHNVPKLSIPFAPGNPVYTNNAVPISVHVIILLFSYAFYIYHQVPFDHCKVLVDFFLSKGAFSSLASWLINDYKVQSKPGHFSSGDKCFSNCSYMIILTQF